MRTRTKVVILLAAAFLIRLVLIIALKTYEYPVKWEYEVIVNNILSGKGFLYNFLQVPYRSFNNPLYSYICAGIYYITAHSYFAVLAVQSLFTVLLAAVVFNISKIMFNEKTGIMAAAIICFHPGLAYYDIFNLIPLSIDSFIIAAIALLFIKFKERPTPLNMALIGAIIGAGVLSRGIIGAILPFLVLYSLISMRSVTIRYRIRAVAFLSLATFAVIAPWIVRNYVIHKQVLIISTTGETFWRGNNMYAVGTSLAKDGRSILELWPEDFRNKIYKMDEMRQKKFFETEALEFIKNHPLDTVKLYIKKMYYFWWFSPQSGALYPRTYLIVYKCLYPIFLIFSAVGASTALFFRGEAPRSNALVMIFILTSVCLTQSLFYVEGRHRWLVEPLLAVFFSYGVLESLSYIKTVTGLSKVKGGRQ